MFKDFNFKYGNNYINFKLPEDCIINELYPKEIEPIADVKQELFSLLDKPSGSKAFNDVFHDGDKVVIIVSDITRLWIGTKKFLPFIVERLNNIGIKDENISILVATGTHRGQSLEELKKIVGEEIYLRIDIVVHDCDKDLVYVGTTSYGTKVEVNKLVTERIEAANYIKPDFLINSIVDPNGNIIRFTAGDWLKAWQEGCSLCDDKFGVPINEKANFVIASCGGYPKDISLYQGVKALFNASLAAKPGGTILFLAECRDGAGADEFFSWIEPLKKGILDEALRDDFTIPGYIFYATVELSQKFNVILLSSIAPHIVEPMGIKATNSIEEALILAGIAKDNQKITVMPYGGTTVPLYTNEE
jgi:lactate racemase